MYIRHCEMIYTIATYIKHIFRYTYVYIVIVSVCGKFAASVFSTVVKYVLKLFAMSALSVQGIPLDVINASVTVVFLFLFFQYLAYCFPCFFPLFLCMSNFSLN